MKLIAMVPFLALFVLGCQIERRMFTVVEVRVVVENISPSPGNSGAAGAIAGGLLFGPAGGVAGYAMTHKDAAPPSGQVTACWVVASARGQTYDFREHHGYAKRCALFRPGDTFLATSTTGVWNGNVLTDGVGRP